MAYVDVQNVYNFKGEQQDFLIRSRDIDGNFQYADNGQRYVLENISSTAGTVLPTIGIMIEF